MKNNTPKTIPVPRIHVVEEDGFDPRTKWAVYINNSLCVGRYLSEQNALNQAEHTKRVLGITQ